MLDDAKEVEDTMVAGITKIVDDNTSPNMLAVMRVIKKKRKFVQHDLNATKGGDQGWITLGYTAGLHSYPLCVRLDRGSRKKMTNYTGQEWWCK